MLMTMLRLDDGRLVTVKHVWTEVHVGGTNIAVLAGGTIYRRTEISADDAEMIREQLMAGGTFDERLNKVEEPSGLGDSNGGQAWGSVLTDESNAPVPEQELRASGMLTGNGN